MAENGVTKVRFDLWAVLAAIFAMSGSGFIYLNNTLAEGRAARIAMDQNHEVRISQLETNLTYIKQGISNLERGQEKTMSVIEAHEKATLSAIRKSRGE